jgi:hypothetical protein
MLSGTGLSAGFETSTPVVLARLTNADGFLMELTCPYVIFDFRDGFGTPVTANLIPTNPPTVSSQPESQVVYAHSNAQFNVTAVGIPPVAYQWELNGTNIAGANSTSLIISNVTPSDLGAYSVVVSNAYGSVISSNALLSMYPYLTVPFGGAITYWSNNLALSVQAWGTGPLNYQWFDNGVAIVSGTNQDLILNGIQFANAGLYSVTVSNSFGSVTNAPEQVVVNPSGVSFGLYPGVTVQGVVGASYIIQSTSDLSNTSWTTLANVTLSQPTQLWIDTSTEASQGTNPHRYYRVLLAP